VRLAILLALVVLVCAPGSPGAEPPPNPPTPSAAAIRMEFPGKSWAEATPASQGVDPARLRGAIDRLAKRCGRDGVRQLLIVRNGRIIWKGDDIDNVHGVWSVTKSFTSTCLGLLVADGKVSLDTRAADNVSALRLRYPTLTLRHVATMTSGYRAAGDEPNNGYIHGPSATPFVPAQPLFRPGEKYAYWDSAMNQFARVLTRAAGEPLEDLFRRRVAGPIGMDPARWDWGDFGEVDGVVVNGGAGNHDKHVRISARELARLGHLFLNHGNWAGRQVLDPKWVAAATRVAVPADMPLAQPESRIDGRGVYGLNWWVNGTGAGGSRKWPAGPAGTFAAAGLNNNHCFVIPEWQMVVVRLGTDGNVPDGVWDEFFHELSPDRK
jgi:CubicO group peptidase (beta-lactamase class C family)